MPRRALVLLVALAGCADQPPPPVAAATPAPVTSEGWSVVPRGPGPRAERIDVDFEGQDLALAMDAIGRQVGRIVVVAPEVRETIRVRLVDLPWREAVDVIARMTRCEVREREDGLLVLEYERRRISVQFESASSTTILQLLGAYCGRTVRVEPWLELQPVSLDLQDGFGPGAEGLVVVARCLGLHVEEQGELLVVTDRPGAGRPLVVPPARATAPRSERLAVRARGARLATLLRLVATEAGLASVAPGLGDARVDVDAAGPPGEVLEALVRAAGARAERVGTTLLVRGASGGACPPPPVVLPELALPVVLTATVETDERALALLDDQALAVGDRWPTPDSGEEVPARLLAVDAGGVTVRVGEREQRVPLR